MHFGLWAAIALVVYAAVKNNITVFTSTKEASVIGVILFVSYGVLYTMLYRGHKIDKKKKQYYMDKAEGKFADPPPEPKMPPWVADILWMFPYISFTGILIYIASSILV